MAKEKKEIKENDEKSTNKTAKKKQNKQLIAIVIFMILLIAVAFLTPYVIKNYINKFNYLNLDFYKNKYGSVILYSTSIPLVDENGKIISSYSMDFRNDPRKLKNIPVNISSINFKENKKTYISVSSEVNPCSDNVLAVMNLASFLGGFGNLDIKGASSDEKYASENNITYVNCKTNPDNVVFILKSGNYTKVEKTDENCYELTYKNCEVTQVTERFESFVLEGYMKNFKRK